MQIYEDLKQETYEIPTKKRVFDQNIIEQTPKINNFPYNPPIPVKIEHKALATNSENSKNKEIKNDESKHEEIKHKLENISKLEIIYIVQSKVPNKIRIDYMNLFYNVLKGKIDDEQERIRMAVREEFQNIQKAINKNSYANVCLISLRKFKAFKNQNELQNFSDNNLTQSQLNNFYQILVDNFMVSDEIINKNYYPFMEISSNSENMSASQTNTRFHTLFIKDTPICIRCGKVYELSFDDSIGCHFHYGKLITNKRKDREFSCCQGGFDSIPCAFSKLHVSESINIDAKSFLSTDTWPEIKSTLKIVAIDCEMCYTDIGLELTRITLVDANLKQVYDEYVKPLYRIRDYNTRFSGINKQTLSKITKTLKDVQMELSKFISSNTIIIGHGLENDLKALKIWHSRFVDTSILFPHHIGSHFKKSLKQLASEFLCKFIQK
ncbi:hypothetical protein HZS_3511, partial [Henneguya salminicola]